MRVFSSSYTFDYNWNEVSTAIWQKYCPWNKASSHVIAVDTLSRHVDPSTGILRTERLITCRQPAPALVTALLGGQCTTHSYETSYVDPQERKVTMYVRPFVQPSVQASPSSTMFLYFFFFPVFSSCRGRAGC